MRNSYVAIVRGVHATTKAIQPLHITSTFDHQRRGAKNDGIAEDKLCTEKIIYNQREECDILHHRDVPNRRSQIWMMMLKRQIHAKHS
jgi:hypothetical protein